MFFSLRYKMAKKLLLDFAPHLPVGSIQVSFPEGDSYSFTGKEKGVDADLKIIKQFEDYIEKTDLLKE